jgi:hypothetical protein
MHKLQPSGTCPFVSEVGICCLHESRRNVQQNFYAALVGHRKETPQSRWVYRRKFITAKHPEKVIPFLHDLNQRDAMIPEVVEFPFITFVGGPSYPAWIFSKVVCGLARNIGCNGMLTETDPNRLLTLLNVQEPTTVVFLRERGDDS